MPRWRGDRGTLWKGGRVRSSAAAGIRLRPDILPLTRTTLPRVQISCLFSAFVLLGYSERLSVHRVGESTCHLPLGKHPQSCELHPRSHRNVAGVKRVRFGHRPLSEPCPCMVKQIISPSPDLNDLSLSRHCHSHWSPDPRTDLAGAGEKILMSEKNIFSAPPIPRLVQWWIDTENLSCLPFSTPQRGLVPPDAQTTSRPQDGC